MVRTLEEFYNNADNFKKNLVKLDEPDEDGKRDYRKAAMLAKFEPYDQVADDLMQGGDVQFESQCMSKFENYMDEYNTLYLEANNIIENPHLYIGAYKEDNIKEIKKIAKDIEIYRGIVKAAANRCAQKVSPTCVDLDLEQAIAGTDKIKILDKYELTRPIDIEVQLPSKRLVYPANCRDRQINFSKNTDGEYLMYLGGNNDKRFFIYCAAMDTKTPQEYLSLKVTSPDPFKDYNVRYNFSKYIDYDTDECIENEETTDGSDPANCLAYQKTTLITTYEKLKVHVNDVHISIDPDQRSVLGNTDSNGNADEIKFHNTNGVEFFDKDKSESVTYSDYGKGSTCSPKMEKTANINLKGTPFVIDNNVEFGSQDKGFEVVYDSTKEWEKAREDAKKKGGSLAIVFEKDNELFAQAIRDYYIGEAWIGYKTKSGKFSWFPKDGKEYFNEYENWADGIWNDILNLDNIPTGADICTYMDSNGDWRHSSCIKKKPYFVEYRKVYGEVKEITDSSDEAPGSGEKQELSIFSQSRLDKCGSYGNVNGEIILNYSPNKAEAIPLLNE